MQQEKLNVYIGWDSREDIAYQVAKHSLIEHSNDINVIPLRQQEMRENGLYKRANDNLASTEFTFTRFYVPYLQFMRYPKDEWAIFVDCDFLFFSNLYAEIDQYLDPKYAVMVVQHDYTPCQKIKMDGKIQTIYPRKNWSSFIAFNCHHPSNKIMLDIPQLTIEDGSVLHRFQWLKDEEIGNLPIDFNWLEGEYERKSDYVPIACHFTNGGPWFPHYMNVDFGREWTDALKRFYFQNQNYMNLPGHLQQIIGG